LRLVDVVCEVVVGAEWTSIVVFPVAVDIEVEVEVEGRVASDSVIARSRASW
jgi:hypothetical protein